METSSAFILITLFTHPYLQMKEQIKNFVSIELVVPNVPYVNLTQPNYNNRNLGSHSTWRLPFQKRNIGLSVYHTEDASTVRRNVLQ